MAFIEGANVSSLVPEAVSAEIIKEIPQQSAALKLAKKAPNMPTGVEKMPVLSVLPTAYFVSGVPEDTSGKKGRRETTKMEWADKYFYAEEIACIVPIENRYLADSRFDVWSEVKQAVAEAFGLVIDAAIFYGTNKPSNWPNGIVTDATSKSMTVTKTSDMYGNLLGKSGVISLVEKQGYMPTGHVASLSMRGELRDVKDDLGRPLFAASMQNVGGYTLDGAPIEFPLNGSIDDSKSLLITGAWNKMLYSFRQDITGKLLTEASIYDPTTGALLYALAQQNMTALMTTMRMAWQLPNPVNRINTNNSTRYPFAVLKPGASS